MGTTETIQVRDLSPSESQAALKIFEWLAASKRERGYSAITLKLIQEDGVTTLAQPSQELRYKDQVTTGRR